MTQLNQYIKIKPFSGAMVGIIGLLSTTPLLAAINIGGGSIDVNVATNSNTPEAAVANALLKTGGVCETLQANTGRNTDEQQLFDVCTALGFPGIVDETVTGPAYRAMSARAMSAITSFSVHGLTTVNMDDIAKRLAALRKGSSTLRNKSAMIDFPQHSSDPQWALLANATGGSAGVDEADGLFDNRLSGFITGANTQAKQTETSTLAGYDSRSNSLTMGLDYRFRADLYAGVATRLVKGDMDLNGNGGSIDMRDTNLTFYSSYYPLDYFYLQGTLSVAQGKFDITRNVNFSINGQSFNEVANSSPDGSNYGASIGGGMDFDLGGQGWSGSTNVNLIYLSSTIDGFTETSGGGFNLIVNEQSIKSLILKTDAQLTKAISTSMGVIMPTITVSWNHEFKQKGEQVSAAFVVDPSQQFSYTTDDRDADYYSYALGATMIFPGGLMGFLQYEASVGITDYDQHAISIGARKEF